MLLWPLVALTALAAEPSPDTEFRGVWVTRWSYRNADDIEKIMADLEAAHANAVLFQVRGRFDALYNSDLEPWAAELTGTLGKDPGWDPLAVAVQSAHAHGLQIHAWMNTFPMWTPGKLPASAGKAHPLVAHPEWRLHDKSGPMKTHESYLFANPLAQGLREHLVGVVKDITGKYAVDGVHLDYLRYPGKEFHDPGHKGLAFKERHAAQKQAIVDTVKAMKEAIEVPLTAAVWGIYEDKWGWNSSQGANDYSQDTAAMCEAGALDASVPMIYWPTTKKPGDRLDFALLAKEHVDIAHGKDVWAGINADTHTWEQITGNIAAAREQRTGGVALFEYLALKKNGWLNDLAKGPWKARAQAPRLLPPKLADLAPDSPAHAAPSP